MRSAILPHTGDGMKGTGQLDGLEKIPSLMLSRQFPSMMQCSKGEFR